MSPRRTPVVALLSVLAVLAVPALAGAASPAGHWPQNRTLPRVSGTTVAGHTLKATSGSWSRSRARKPSAYSFAWLRCTAHGRTCRAIAKAHSRRYVLRAKDVGHRLRVRVTAVRRIGAGRALRVSAQSRATHLVRSAPAGGGAPGGPLPGSGLHVSGNKLLDASNNAVHLHGVNFPGTEYACIQGWGIFDGPSDDASIAAIRSWNSNVVHLGLNEDCILGINGVSSQYGGTNYMNAITDYVKRLHAHGLYAEISLMWAAPGSQQATDHPDILDADHAPAALKAIANAFKNDPDTFIGLQSEPHNITWACWKSGGSSCSESYTALGMQGALDAVRSTGATNVVTASGIDYSNNLQKWLQNRPTDPAGQLMAEAHIYGGNACDNASCLDSTVAPVAAQVPVVFGETGESYDASDCGSSSIATIMNWADAHGVGYEAWQWNTWGNCLDLIAGFDGTPASNSYAKWVHTHYAGL